MKTRGLFFSFLAGALLSMGGLALPFPARGIVLVFSPFKEAGENGPLFGKIPPWPFPQEKVQHLLDIAAEINKKRQIHYQTLMALYNITPEEMAAVLSAGSRSIAVGAERFRPGAAGPLLEGADGGFGSAESGHQIQKGGILPEELSALYQNADARQLINFIERRGLSPHQIVLVLLPPLRNKNLSEDEALSLILPVVSRFGLSPGARLSAGDITAMLPPELSEKLEAQKTIASFAHLAAIRGRKKLLAMLYSREGFDPNLRDAADRSPLHALFSAHGERRHWPLEEWQKLIFAIQKNSKTDFNLKDSHGMTPLATAAFNGLFHAVRVLSEIPEIDLSVKDNYGRTLPIIASTSKEPNRREITRFLLQKGGEHLAEVSGLNNYITESLDPVTLAAAHPLESARIHAISFLSRKEIQNPEDFAQLQKRGASLQKVLEARAAIDASLKRDGGGYEDRYFLARAIEESDMDFIAGYQDQKSAGEERNFLEEHFLFFAIYESNIPGAKRPRIHVFRTGHFLLSAINRNDPYMTNLLLEILKDKGHIFRPSPESLPDLPWEEIQGIFTGTPWEKSFEWLPKETSEEIFFMDPLSEALLVSAAIQSETQIENRDFEIRKSQEILKALISHSSLDLSFRSFMNLTPMETAILTGHLDVVKDLQKKGVPFSAEGSLWETAVPLEEAAREMGFKRMAKYLDEKAPNPKGVETCRRWFFH